MALISPQGWTGSWSHGSTTSTFTGSGAYAGRTIVATSSAAVNGTCYPGVVFDSNLTYSGTTIWQVAGNQTITFNFGVGYSLKVNSYKVWNGNSGFYSNSWTLSGSNDGTNWTSLDVRAVVGLISGSEYTISSPAFYQYYKIVVSDAYGSYSTFNELEFYGEDRKTIGYAGSTYTYQGTNNVTTINKAHPAPISGVIKKIYLEFQDTNASNVKVGTFYGSGSSFTNRDYATIGTVVYGSIQSFNVSISVEIGDYIGIYWNGNGQLKLADSGVANTRIYCSGDVFGGTVQTYTN